MPTMRQNCEWTIRKWGPNRNESWFFCQKKLPQIAILDSSKKEDITKKINWDLKDSNEGMPFGAEKLPRWFLG
jgi:hypothetical protein